jgi:cytochrome c-type biogenesis protein
VLSIPDVAMFLQKNMNKFLGPILVVVGLFLLRLINLRLPSVGASDKLQRRVDAWGIWGAGLMGLLFALSFCPVSAALFFGGLIPIAIEQESNILMPTVYGIGTALPVVAFALVIALGTRFVGQLFNRLTIFEKWARRITGVVFLAVGLYYVLVYLVGWQI